MIIISNTTINSLNVSEIWNESVEFSKDLTCGEFAKFILYNLNSIYNNDEISHDRLLIESLLNELLYGDIYPIGRKIYKWGDVSSKTKVLIFSPSKVKDKEIEYSLKVSGALRFFKEAVLSIEKELVEFHEDKEGDLVPMYSNIENHKFKHLIFSFFNQISRHGNPEERFKHFNFLESVNSVSFDGVKVQQLKGGSYVVQEMGKFGDVILTLNEVFISLKFLKIIQSIDTNSFQFTPIEISRVASNEKWEYYKITTKEQLTYEQAATENPVDGCKFWVNNSFLITPDFKLELLKYPDLHINYSKPILLGPIL